MDFFEFKTYMGDDGDYDCDCDDVDGDDYDDFDDDMLQERQHWQCWWCHHAGNLFLSFLGMGVGVEVGHF